MENIISKVARWRITDDNPSRMGDELDFERCAALHNFILEVGWLQSGRRLVELDRRSWWEYHGAAAEAVRERLAPSVVKFLQRAQVGTSDGSHTWFYYFRGITDPGEIFDARGGDYEGDDTYIVLYPLTLSLSWSRGLV